MSDKIVQLNGEVNKGQFKELLEVEAEKRTQAAWYGHNEQRQGYRSGHYSRNLTAISRVCFKTVKTPS